MLIASYFQLTYEAGGLVIHHGLIYATKRSFDYAFDPQITPDQGSATDWLVQPPMADDVRQLKVSEFAHIGLMDLMATDLIFLHGFE